MIISWKVILGSTRLENKLLESTTSQTFKLTSEFYIKVCDVYLASKVVWYKLYRDLQLLLVSTH